MNTCRASRSQRLLAIAAGLALAGAFSTSSAFVGSGYSVSEGVYLGIQRPQGGGDEFRALLPVVSGSAPDPYSVYEQISPLYLENAVNGYMSASSVEVMASSDVDYEEGDKLTMAGGALHDVDLALFPDPEGTPFFRIQAENIASSSQIFGDTGHYELSGSTSIVAGVLTIAGQEIAMEENPGPNTLIYNQRGIRVTLNQTTALPSDENPWMYVSAISVGFDLVQVPGGVVGGSIVFAFSHEEVASVPEPGTLAFLGAGLLIFVLWRKR